MKKTLFVLLVLVFLLSACNPVFLPETPMVVKTQVVIAATDDPTPMPSATTEAPPPEPLTLAEVSLLLVKALARQDMPTVAQYVHPQMGLRFSPYGYIQAGDLVFSAGQLATLFADSRTYTWGAYDGSGEPIALGFGAYYAQFVYSADFANPEQVGYNTQLGMGNTINNIAEVYPNAQFVEFYFSGFDPQYGGMDWQSLRLVLMQEGDAWFLLGIVHDQWTI